MKKMNILLLCALAALASSCGDMFMQKQEKKKMSQLLSCSADPSALSKIFTENIQGDLACLEESLELFVEIVWTDRPGNLSYEELTDYIGNNMKDVDESLFEPLKGFFAVNALLTGDDPLYIKKENIAKIVDMLEVVNKVMVENRVYEFFVEERPISYEAHTKRKAAIFNAFAEVEKALKNLHEKNGNEIVLTEFLEKFKDAGNSHILDNSEKLLFIKRVFLGGEKNKLTSAELKDVLSMLADASKIAYDILHLPNVEQIGQSQEEILESLKEDFETISKNLYRPEKGEAVSIVTLEDIRHVAEEFFPQALEYLRYEEAVLQAKRTLLGNDGPFFTANELKTLVEDIALKNLRRGVFFFKSYAANKHILDRPWPIRRDLPHVIASNAREERFKEDFNRIAKDYWFFVDNEMVASYKGDIERSAWGMFVTATLEDLVARVYSNYTPKNGEAYGGYAMSMEQIQRLLEDFKGFLNGQELILPGREASASETIALMTALFQKQSDGKGDDIEVNETVELLTTMLSGLRLSGVFYEEVSAKCALDKQSRFMPSCMMDHFSSVFDMRPSQGARRFEEYFPKLADYARSMNKSSSDAFVEKMNIFTRTCREFKDGSPVPVSRGDLFLFFAGLMNIESTYTVFDRSGGPEGGGNNMLEVRELNRAYDEVYRRAIEAKVPKALSWRARDVFFYLLDKGKEPSALEMIFRIVPAGYPQAPANRSSVASVLKVISEGSETNQESAFNCELLR